MVNAVALSDHEVWLFVASLAFSAMVGFFVAYLQSIHTVRGQEQSNRGWLISAIVFAVLFVVFFGRAIVVRLGLRQNARTYQMTASSRVE